jgi:hypothetical protein
MVCFGFPGADPVGFGVPARAGLDSFLIFAHRACCARAILRRDAAEMTRDCAVVFPDVPAPLSDSMTEIACSNFSTCDCALLRSARSS